MLSIKNSIILQMLSAVYMPFLPPFISVKYPFVLVTLIWVYLTFSSFILKALCTRLLILDFKRSCGYVSTDVTVRTSSWSYDNNRLVESFRIHMLTPLWLVLVLQYLTNPSFMVLSSLVRRHDRPFVIHLLGPAINRCLYIDLCSLDVQYRYGRF